MDDLGAGDEYESDDTDGVPIAVGGAQQRTFYPAGDIDRVYFVAKSNQRYRVHTSNLTGLVDTVITVDMGSVHLTNDDRIPGDLSSQIELQNTGPSDSRVMVTISNKGPYAMEGGYNIHVTDLAADQGGDEFEPDLEEQRSISINEAQRHTFHPELDVDRVHLTVKAGRSYVVYTCGSEGLVGEEITSTEYLDCDQLPWGTDTLLTVLGPIQNCDPASCQNDDAFPGSGYLNSRVFFEALVDGRVTITIYSKGLFGPTMVYYLAVQELGAPAPTPAGPTPTPFFSPVPTATGTVVPPPTATATEAPYVAPPSATPPVTPTPTATEEPYAPPPPTATSVALNPTVRALAGLGRSPSLLGRVHDVYDLSESPMGKPLFKPLFNPLLKPHPQNQGGTVRFVLLLKMKRVRP